MTEDKHRICMLTIALKSLAGIARLDTAAFVTAATRLEAHGDMDAAKLFYERSSITDEAANHAELTALMYGPGEEGGTRGDGEASS